MVNCKNVELTSHNGLIDVEKSGLLEKWSTYYFYYFFFSNGQNIYTISTSYLDSDWFLGSDNNCSLMLAQSCKLSLAMQLQTGPPPVLV